MKLTKLKVRPQKVIESSPCIVELGALFECWALSGVDDKACLNAANSLKTCMTKVVSTSLSQCKT